MTVDNTHDLPVDWSMSSSSSIDEAEQRVEAIKMDVSKLELSPRVSFSETSTLSVYKRDEAYSKERSYSSAEYELLKLETLLDARRVKELISRAPPVSTKDSVKFLIERGCFIEIAGLVGIEHCVLGNGGFARKTR